MLSAGPGAFEGIEPEALHAVITSLELRDLLTLAIATMDREAVATAERIGYALAQLRIRLLNVATFAHLATLKPDEQRPTTPASLPHPAAGERV